MARRQSWDIFCTVVDNFGDIGVTWRLARQLANEQRRAVRLWVDDLESFSLIAPAVDPSRDAQSLAGVEVRRWRNPFPDAMPADAVVEAFACHLPESYVANMAACVTPPAWINLEYLSAETWVEGTHALPSPHPRLPLVKYFFFPGFTGKTGGLLRERGLVERRDAFRGDTGAQDTFWKSLGLAPRNANELRVLLFVYANPAIVDLLEFWAASPQTVCCIVPEGPVVPEVRDFFAAGAAPTLARGNLSVRVIPFLEQEDFDRLLWACDVNFVRGEDSFARAQWAARPFVWHIYPQQEDAHRPKLDAFLDRFCVGLDANTRARVIHLWHAWNQGGAASSAVGGAWRDFITARESIGAHGESWSAHLSARADLASALADFCDNLL